MEKVLSAQVLLIADKNLKITDARESACVGPARAVQTTSLGDLIGKSLPESIAGLDPSEALQACETILSGGRFPSGFSVYRNAVMLFHPEPERRVILLSPNLNDAGVSGITCRIASTFLQYPQADALTPEDYQAMVENSMEFMFAIDQLGFHTYVSPSIRATMGAEPDNVYGMHMSEIVHPEDIERCQSILSDLSKQGVPMTDIQYRLILPDGSQRHIAVRGERLNVGGGVRYMGIAKDVTETMQLREKLQARQEALAVLSSIVLTLSRAESINDALRAAMEQILAFLGLSSGGIIAVSADGTEYMASALIGGGGIMIAPEHILASLDAVCPEAESVKIIDDVATDQRLDEVVRASVLEIGVKSFALVRLRSMLGQHACIGLAGPPSGELSVEQIEFLDLASRILGAAIENAILQGEVADRANRLAMLERMALSINSGLDVPSIFTACQAGLRELIDCDDVCLVVFGGNQIADVYSFEGGSELVHTRKKLTQQHFRTFKATYEMHSWAKSSEMQSYRIEHKEREITSGMVAVSPLIYKGTVTGLLKIWSQKEDVFGRREGSILQAVAEHLAIAVANARLYGAEHARTLELEVLGREMQHRIKNNLQTIAGLLSISSQEGEQSTRALERCMGQIGAISTVHSLLTPKHLASGVRLKKLLTEVAQTAVAAAGRSEDVRVTVEGRDRALSPDTAVAIGVIANELVSNAVEHGLAGRNSGEIAIRVSVSPTMTVVEVSDDGVGLPKTFNTPRKAKSGLGLVSSLVEHGLHGKFSISRSEPGTLARIEF